MTDLHTHILPGMDDGASDIRTALRLLELEYRQGVDRIALTSHYRFDHEPVEDFLRRREASVAELQEYVPPAMKLKRGCEVAFSPELMGMDVRPLCLEGTNVLLLELPVMQRPAFLTQTLEALRHQGIVPLIAHAERYVYVENDPALLAEWIGLGARIQVNASSLLREGQRLPMRLVKWGLVHVVASDTHSVDHRPPNLRAGLDRIAKVLGPETARRLEKNAKLLFQGRNVPQTQMHIPKKVLGLWV